MAIKVGRMVAYFESLLTVKSLCALITWSGQVKRQTKILLYSQLEYYELGRMITQLDEFLMWSCEIT